MTSSPGVAQAKTLADRLQREPQAVVDDVAADPEKPLVLIPSALSKSKGWNRLKEARMMEHFAKRIRETKEEMGHTDFTNGSWYEAAHSADNPMAQRFMPSRFMADNVFAMNYDWRPHTNGGIFTESNLHVPITRMILDKQIAACIRHYTGTKPWFSARIVTPEEDLDAEQTPPADPTLEAQQAIAGDPMAEMSMQVQQIESIGKLSDSDRTNRWLQHDLEKEGCITTRVNSGINKTIARGEAVFKTFFERKYSYYQQEREVLISPKTGAPVTDAMGEYIDRVAKWAPNEQGGMVLLKDGVTPMPSAPEELQWEKLLLWHKKTIREGAQCQLLETRDFLAPLVGDDLDDLDFCAHLTDERLIDLVNRYQHLPSDSPEQVLQRVSKMLQTLMPRSSTTTHSAASAAQTALREPEGQVGQDRQEPLIHQATCCGFYDADEDGNNEDILVIMTVDGTPIFYDYVPNVTHDGRRPFRKMVINQVANRWHGQGSVATLEPVQTLVDLQWNRRNFSQSGAGRVDCVDATAVYEGDGQNENLNLNCGETFHLKPNKKIDDFWQFKELPDTKGAELKDMIEFGLQLATNMSGVSGPNDAAAAGLETSDLATGINAIQQVNDLVLGKLIADLEPGIMDLTECLAQMEIAHLGEDRTFTYQQDQKTISATITPDQLEGKAVHIQLDLTQNQGQETVALTKAATDLVERFYLLPFPVQQRVCPLYIQNLRAFKVDKPEQYIRPLNLAALMPLPGPGAIGSGSGPPGSSAAPTAPGAATPSTTTL